MHAAELMARLNPSTVRYDVGRGGLPELTSQDIAAAIAMVPAGIGRELMCRLWWPDGAALAPAQLERALTDVLIREWTEREKGMYVGLGAVASAENARQLEAATRVYAQAHARRWPGWIERAEPLTIKRAYQLLQAAVIAEIRQPRRCPACGGAGTVPSETVTGDRATCERCAGQGTVKQGPTWRAAALYMKESSYKETWHDPYEWLLAFVLDESSRAVEQLKKAVGRGNPVTEK